MTALLLEFWPYIAGAVAAAFGAWKLWTAGAASERNKQRAKEADAYEKHLKDISAARDARNNARVQPDDPRRRD